MISWIRALHVLSIVLGAVFFNTGAVLFGTIPSYILVVLGLVLIGLGIYGFICIGQREESIREAETEDKSQRTDEEE